MEVTPISVLLYVIILIDIPIVIKGLSGVFYVDESSISIELINVFHSSLKDECNTLINSLFQRFSLLDYMGILQTIPRPQYCHIHQMLARNPPPTPDFLGITTVIP